MVIRLSLFVFLFASQQIAAQPYHKVRIHANDYQMRELTLAGVCMDHGSRKKDTWFTGDVSEQELAIVEALGVDYEVLIEDVSSWYVSQNHQHNAGFINFGDPHMRSHARSSCGPVITPVQDPAGFQLGTMGGFLKYAEFIQQIDAMAAQYPNLISAKTGISGFQTHELRPIYWLRISNNPNVVQGKPEILYTAIPPCT
jgi:carboxypeptidase T